MKFWKKFESGTNQEQIYKKSGLQIDFDIFKNAQKLAKKLPKVKNVIILKISFKLILPNLQNFGRF